MNGRYILIALATLVAAVLACNRTVPTATPEAATAEPTHTRGGGTPIADIETPTLAVTSSWTATAPSPATGTPTGGAPACRLDADFIADVTIPDNTELEPGVGFAKTWRMSNSGTCAWDSGTVWAFESGDKMDGPDAVDVPIAEPGATVDITVNLTAPDAPGTYAGSWRMRQPSDEVFGTQGIVRIVVIEPEATTTPTPTATIEPSAGPTIVSFRSKVDEASPGDTISLTWDTENATSASLYHLMPTGQLGTMWNVDIRGTFDYQINAAERNQTRFLLVVSDDEQRTAQEFLSIALLCPDTWFFHPAPDECPASAALVSDGAEQRFERGTMIWVRERDQVYVLFDDDQSPKWRAYADNWDDGDPVNDPGLTPPPGLYQPVRGFGLIWRTEPGVRDRLGWGVDPEDAYTTVLQSTSRAKYNDLFIRALDGNVWKLLPESSGWEKISASSFVPTSVGLESVAPTAVPAPSEMVLEVSDPERALVYRAEDGRVTAYDCCGFEKGTVLNLPTGTHEDAIRETGLRLSEAGDRLYASYQDQDGRSWIVSVVLDTGETITGVRVPSGPWTLMPNPNGDRRGTDGSRLHFSDADMLLVLDGETLDVVHRLYLTP
jgi:hypothetical protein